MENAIKSFKASRVKFFFSGDHCDITRVNITSNAHLSCDHKYNTAGYTERDIIFAMLTITTSKIGMNATKLGFKARNRCEKNNS